LTAPEFTRRITSATPTTRERYIFFSKCVAHLARYLPWRPDIVHVHDWQTALVPALMLHQKRAEGWGNPPPTCLTIHNLAYQGIFPPGEFKLTNLPWDFFTADGAEFYGQLNCLKAGIVFANVITTVSPRYAREITTEALGCALDDRLRLRREQLFGILNGVDYEEWNTLNNPFLAKPFSATRLAGKKENKADLQKQFGLPVEKKSRCSAPFRASRNKKAWTSSSARWRKC
jgi:starch synthase